MERVSPFSTAPRDRHRVSIEPIAGGWRAGRESHHPFVRIALTRLTTSLVAVDVVSVVGLLEGPELLEVLDDFRSVVAIQGHWP